MTTTHKVQFLPMVSGDLYMRTPDVIEADVGGEIVLLHTQSWQYFEFDKVGSAIWGLLSAPASLDALVASLTNQFEVDETRCREETRSFLNEMIEQGLITVGNG